MIFCKDNLHQYGQITADKGDYWEVKYFNGKGGMVRKEKIEVFVPQSEVTKREQQLKQQLLNRWNEQLKDLMHRESYEACAMRGLLNQEIKNLENL